MKSKKDKLFKESMDFITKNPNITSDLIPNHLLENWKEQDASSDSSYELEVFLFIYSAYTVRKTGNTIVNLNAEKTNELFGKFQSVLALESLRRKVPIDYRKVKIFDFDDYGDDVQISIKDNDIEIINELGKILNINPKQHN